MKYKWRAWATWTALLALSVGATVAATRPALAQTDPRPAWMRDSVLTQNRYLMLWSYFQSGEVTKFDIWNNEGDPETQDDNFLGFFLNAAGDAYVRPWASSRLISGRHPLTGTNADDRVWANHVTIRVVDPTTQGGFTDLTFPDDGVALLSPPIAPLPNGQGYYAPYTFENGTLQITQRVQFARDLVRVEYQVRNLGGSARQVGVRLLLDSYVDWQGPTRSFFIPTTQERLFLETDYGLRTGTTTTPTNPIVPQEWLHFDQDEDPNAVFVAKGILSGNGATTPTRVAFHNSLNSFPLEGTWDYDFGRFPMELRISDQAVMLWWDPVNVTSTTPVTFATYAGVGVASHVMSQAYLLGQDRSLRDTNAATQNKTYGYIGAVQAPFALPLVDGNADQDASGTPLVHSIKAYMQNMYHDFNIPNGFAFLTLPDGLRFANAAQSARVDFGNIQSLGSGSQDEGVGQWQVQATGIEAGLRPIDVSFTGLNNDAARVTRMINIPQGRLYQFEDDWRMVTFPFNYTQGQDDPAEVLGLLPGSYQLKYYNPLTNTYDDAQRIQPGVGYWVRLLGGGATPVRIQNAEPIELTSNNTYQTQLVRGWNLVGNASPYAVPLRRLQFLLRGGLPIPFEQATQRNLIRSSIYRYNRKQGLYEQVDVTEVIQPGEGLWIYSNGEQVLMWPAPEGPRLSISP